MINWSQDLRRSGRRGLPVQRSSKPSCGLKPKAFSTYQPETFIVRIFKLTLLGLISLSFLGVSANPARTAKPETLVNSAQRRDKVIATRSATGTLKGFEVGDYMHAVINLANGKENSYFIGQPGLEYFLALHKDEPLVLTYQVVNSYIPEAGGSQRIERLSGARAGSLTYASWWKKMRAKHSLAQLDKMYGKAVEKLRLNP
jgi:hypothetical protein